MRHLPRRARLLGILSLELAAAGHNYTPARLRRQPHSTCGPFLPGTAPGYTAGHTVFGFTVPGYTAGYTVPGSTAPGSTAPGYTAGYTVPGYTAGCRP